MWYNLLYSIIIKDPAEKNMSARTRIPAVLLRILMDVAKLPTRLVSAMDFHKILRLFLILDLMYKLYSIIQIFQHVF